MKILNKKNISFFRKVYLDETNGNLLGFLIFLIPLLLATSIYIFIRFDVFRINELTIEEIKNLVQITLMLNIVFFIGDSFKKNSNIIKDNLQLLKFSNIQFEILLIGTNLFVLITLLVRLIFIFSLIVMINTYFIDLYDEFRINGYAIINFILTLIYTFNFSIILGLVFSPICVISKNFNKVTPFVILPFLILSPIFFQINSSSILFIIFNKFNPVSIISNISNFDINFFLLTSIFISFLIIKMILGLIRTISIYTYEF